MEGDGNNHPIASTSKCERSISKSTAQNTRKRSNSTEYLPTSKKQNSLPCENETYDASGLKNFLHGNVFQLKILMVIAKRCQQRGYNFRLATEMDDARSFDDLVIWYTNPADNSLNAIFLQAKHTQVEIQGKTTIKYNDLFKKKDDRYNLNKYFTSYLKIKERQLADNGKFYIYTNIGFDFDKTSPHGNLKKLSTFYFESVTGEESLLNFSKSCYYRLVNSSNKDHPSIVNQLKGRFTEADENDIKEFIDHLIFAVNQPNETDLSRIVNEEIGEEFNLIDANFVADYYQHIFLNWIKEKQGTYLSENKINQFFIDIREKIAQLVVLGITTARMKELVDSQIEFNEDALFNSITTFLNQNLVTRSVMHLISNDDSMQLCAIKVNQILRERYQKYNKRGSLIFGPLSRLVKLERTVKEAFISNTIELLVIEAFKHKTTELLVIECDKIDTDSVRSFYDGLSFIMMLNNKDIKKIIFIASENDENVQKVKEKLSKTSMKERPIEDRKTQEFSLTVLNTNSEALQNSNFQNLSKSSQDKLLEKTVTFQGYGTSLSNIISIDSNAAKLLPLHNLVYDMHVKIGEPLATSSAYDESYYIDRTIQLYADVDESKFKQMLSSLLKHDQNEFKVHWLERDNKTKKWLNITEDVQELKKKFSSNPHLTVKLLLDYPPNLFEKFLEDTKQHRIIMISDSAGMGKSTFITHTSKIIKQIYPFLWVTKIDLNEYTNVLNSLIDTKFDVIDVLIDKLLKLDSKLEKNIFRQLLQENKVILMIDGFDEISPVYEKVVLHIINGLKSSTSCQLWITTRPHLKEVLENELEILSCTLKPFTKTEQIIFLSKSWNQKKEIQDDSIYRLKYFAKNLVENISKSVSDQEQSFVSIPLQTRLIAEVFAEEAENFLSSDLKTLDLSQYINVVNLYEQFIKKKFNIYFNDKLQIQIHNVVANEAREREFAYFVKQHQLLALEEILAKEDAEKIMELFTEFRKSNFDKSHIVRYGIVKNVDKKVQFIHRTFAEYFMILLLMKQIGQPLFQDFLCNNILLHSDYRGLRKFLNSILKTTLLEKSFIFKKINHEKVCQILRVTAVENNEEILLYLINSLEINENIEDSNQLSLRSILVNDIETAVIVYDCALQSKSQNLIDVLIEIAFQEITFNLKDSLFIKEAQYGNVERIKLFLKNGVNVNAINDKKETALHWAAYKGHSEVVQALIENGANVNIVNYENETPLHWAVEENHLEIMNILLQNSANINAINDKKESPLHLAAYKGNLELVKALIENGANVNIVNYENETPLHLAAYKGHLEVIKMFLDNGVNVNKIDNSNKTALHCAAMRGDSELIEILLNHGANINAFDRQKLTPLHWAAKEGHSEIVKILLNKGADMHAVDIENETILHKAAQNGHSEIVKILLECGANMNAVNREDEMPLEMAAERGHTEVVEILMLHGAKLNANDNELFVNLEKINISSPASHLEVVKTLEKSTEHRESVITEQVSNVSLQYETSFCLHQILQGMAYQSKIIMLIAYRCHKLNYSFRLAVDMKEAEKFDDVVLWYKKPGDDTQHKIFLQTKHFVNKNLIKYKDLFGRKAYIRFNLLTYFKSFLKIKERKLAVNGKFYIYTNIGFNFDEHFLHTHLKKMATLYFEPVAEEQPLFNYSQGDFYRLVNYPNSEGPSVVEQLQKMFQNSDAKDIEEFLDHFIFSVNQPNEAELSKIIESEFKTDFNEVDAKFLTKLYQDNILNWIKYNTGTYYTENDIFSFLNDTRKVFAQFSTDQVNSSLQKTESCASCEIYKEAFVKVLDAYSIMKKKYESVTSLTN